MDIIEDISQKNIDALPFDEWAEMACLDFDGDVINTDPCYLLHGIDRNKYRNWWDFSNKIILEGGLESSTYYGDWGCTVYKKVDVLPRLKPWDSRLIAVHATLLSERGLTEPRLREDIPSL